MTNSPTFKLLDLPSLRRSSPWDLRNSAKVLSNRDRAEELRALADFREDQLFESGARLKERLEQKEAA